MQKYSKVMLKKKGKKTFMKVFYNQTEGNGLGNTFEVKWVKESDQYLSKDLEWAFARLVPHLLYASELIDDSINLDKDMNYEKWFNECAYHDDSRFDGLVLTEIEFIGTEALDAVRMKGYKSTQKTAKEFKVPIPTPVINLDRVAENRYALVSILDAQLDDLQLEITEWLEKGKTLTKAQQASLFDEHEEAA
jgi:hypothetical protein